MKVVAEIYKTYKETLKTQRELEDKNQLLRYTTTPTTLGVGVKRSKFNYSEHDHVAYQIKGYRERNMLANILPANHPQPWGSKR